MANKSQEESLKRGKKAYVDALRLLAYKPRTRMELCRKLKKKGYTSREILSVIERLKDLGYINDTEYARRWAECAIRDKRYGSLRIEMELRKRGIERSLAASTAGNAFSGRGEDALALEAVMHKAGAAGTSGHQAGRRRLIGYLLRKGFPRSIAIRAVRECERISRENCGGTTVEGAGSGRG